MKRNQKLSRKAITMATLTGSMFFLNSCQLFQTEPAPQIFNPRQIVPAPSSTPQTSYETAQPAYVAPKVEEIKPASLDLPKEEPLVTEEIVVEEKVEAPKPERIVYTVRKGDSLWKIGRQYGVSYKELAAENGLDAKKHLKVGMKLTIPSGGKFRTKEEIKSSAPKRTYKVKFDTKPVLTTKKSSKSKKSSSKTKKTAIPTSGEYTVKKGDNLWVIAKRHDLRVQQIREWNKLSSDRLKVGQKLNLKGAVAQASTPTITEPKIEEIAPVVVDTTPETPVENTDVGVIIEGGETTANEETTTVVDNEGTTTETPKEEKAPVDPTEGAELVPVEVYEGDTLESIAQDFSSTVELIKAANPSVKSNADLKEGMMLKIPLKE